MLCFWDHSEQQILWIVHSYMFTEVVVYGPYHVAFLLHVACVQDDRYHACVGNEQTSTADIALLKFPVVNSTCLFLLKNIQRIYLCSTQFCALCTHADDQSILFLPQEGGEILETFLKIYLTILVAHSSPGVSGYMSLMTTEIIRVMQGHRPCFFSVFFSARQSTEKYSMISEQ